MSIHAFAALILRSKAAQIEAALRPGKSQDPFALVNPYESAVLMEAVKFGLPFQSREHYTEASDVRTLLLTDGERHQEPSYANELWSKTGYSIISNFSAKLDNSH